MRSVGEGVLIFARYVPLRSHVFGGNTHAIGDGDMVVLEHRGRHSDLVAHHRHHAHRFGACCDHQIGFAQTDAVSCQSDGLQAGGTESVDGLRRYRLRQAGQQGTDTCHIHALFAFGHGATDDDVIDALGVDARGLRDDLSEAVCQHVGGVHILESAARGFGHRGTGGGNDISFLDGFHGGS